MHALTPTLTALVGLGLVALGFVVIAKKQRDDDDTPTGGAV